MFLHHLGEANMAKTLIESGANIETTMSDGITPLIEAVASSNK